LSNRIIIYIVSIGGVYRRKAVVRNWFGNGEQISLRGKLELLQQTEYDVTNVEVSLEGLDGKMSGYHIHMVIFINTYKDFMAYIYGLRKNIRYIVYFCNIFLDILFLHVIFSIIALL